MLVVLFEGHDLCLSKTGRNEPEICEIEVQGDLFAGLAMSEYTSVEKSCSVVNKITRHLKPSNKHPLWKVLLLARVHNVALH